MVRWDTEVSGPDDFHNKITISKCNDYGLNVRSCYDQRPSNTIRWSACAAGSSPGGIAPGDGARVCGHLSKDVNDFTCDWAQNCFAVTSFTPPPEADVVWDDPVEKKDGRGSTVKIQKCNKWINNDPKSCLTSKTRPDPMVKWATCAIGSSPGGIAPGDSAGACSEFSKNIDDFPCAGGQNCFAVISHDVTWDPEVKDCDGEGHRLTIQKCNGWISDNPRSCLDSPSKPKNITNWINCGIGSSPGGMAHGDSARVCSPLSKDANDFTCVGGQNCFAVTSNETDSSCPQTNPLAGLGQIWQQFLKWAGIIIGILLLISCLFFIGREIFKAKLQGRYARV